MVILLQKIAKFYCENINNNSIILPNYPQNQQSCVWHLFVIRCDKRDDLQKYLLEKGVQTVIHYPIPPHKQGAYREFNHLHLPITEKIHQEVLSLPIYPGITAEDMAKIVNIINNY